jgi:predicted DNA-binding protein (MmcQ/YjbR family)
MADHPHHRRLLRIVESLPGAYEDRPWGGVHCKVAGKIFVSWGRDDDGALALGFKTDKQLQQMLVDSDPRFAVAAYVGKHGWVRMKPGPRPKWAELEHFIVESYRMIAPRRLVKELDARDAQPPPRRTRSTPKKRARRAVSRARRARRPRGSASGRGASVRCGRSGRQSRFRRGTLWGASPPPAARAPHTRR